MKKIKDLLDNNNLTIAVAESLTSGLVQNKMAKLIGSSSFFEGGITVYSLRQKVELLGVDETLAKECNCVSQEVAHQMSKGVANKFDADIGVATTGYAEPDIVNGIPIPFAFISVFFKGVSIGLRVQGDISMTRTKMRNFVTKEVVVNIHKIIKHAVEKQTKTIQEQVDSGELSLQTNRTEIVFKGHILNSVATFLRHDEKQGYIFVDSYGDLKIIKSLDDPNIRYFQKLKNKKEA